MLNHLINRTINASAEALNSKMKQFRAQLHGVTDLPFFIYCLCIVFGVTLPRKLCGYAIFLLQTIINSPPGIKLVNASFKGYVSWRRL